MQRARHLAGATPHASHHLAFEDLPAFLESVLLGAFTDDVVEAHPIAGQENPAVESLSGYGDVRSPRGLVAMRSKARRILRDDLELCSQLGGSLSVDSRRNLRDRHYHALGR